MNRVWTQTNATNDGRPVYTTPYFIPQKGFLYLFWYGAWGVWTIDEELGSSSITEYCNEDELSDCTEGDWGWDWSGEPATIYMADGDECTAPTSSPTPAPTRSPIVDGCTPRIETLGFYVYDENMDGAWLRDAEQDIFRLNISETAGIYTIQQIEYPLLSYTYWSIQKIDVDGVISNWVTADYMPYCTRYDLGSCDGNWMVNKDKDDTLSYYYDPTLKSKYIDCLSISECDVIGLSANETAC